MDKKYELELVGITYNQLESGVYALILQQVGASRRIPIIIGNNEAQAIECKLQDVQPPRPMTHDLVVETLKAFGIRLSEIDIKKFSNGVFGADLVFTDGTQTHVVDARASDAIALSLRTGAPIYTSEDVIIQAGFEPEDVKPKQSPFSFSGHSSYSRPITKKESGYKNMTSTQLAQAMAKAVENENYEEAAKIKAELDNRNNQNDQS